MIPGIGGISYSFVISWLLLVTQETQPIDFVQSRYNKVRIALFSNANPNYCPAIHPATIKNGN